MKVARRLCQELHTESCHHQIILPCVLGPGFVTSNNQGTQMHLKSLVRKNCQFYLEPDNCGLFHLEALEQYSKDHSVLSEEE